MDFAPRGPYAVVVPDPSRTSPEAPPPAPDARAADPAAPGGADRWSELAGMAPVLVHDLRQPLSVMKVNLQLLVEDLDDAQDAAPHPSLQRALRRAAGMRTELDRLDGILRDFRRFASGGEPVLRRTELRPLLEELVDFFRPQAAQHAIRVDLPPSPPGLSARVDPDRLKEALLNLLVNAQQALEPAGGGTVVLRLRDAEGPATPSAGVAMDVEDDGPGIPAELMPRLFQASFTTKPDGSGLGLPTVRRLVELQGGRVTASAGPGGRGARFTVTFPGPARGDDLGSPPPAHVGGPSG